MDIDDVTFELRPSSPDDFWFAWALYRDLMEPLTVELLGWWNELAQQIVVKDAVAHDGTSIILVDGSDSGWLQVLQSPDTMYLGQIYILPALQNRGIGTSIVQGLCDTARHDGKTFTLDVMRNNRARALYERLGFHVVGETEYKFEMQWLEDGESTNPGP